MEEILASIRRIIADDEAKPAAAEKPASPVAAVPEAPARPSVMRIFRLRRFAPRGGEAGRSQARAAASRRRRQPVAMQQSGRHRRDARQPRCGNAPRPTSARHSPTGMYSNSPTRWHWRIRRRRRHRSARSSRRTTWNLARRTSVKARQPAYEPSPFESEPPAQQILSRSTVSAVESAFNSLANTVLSNNARTMEDLVKEMLRPMLKSWLDDNLPGLVERIVKAEIERVSRGR